MDEVEATEAELRDTVAAQQREIDELKARLASPATSRRNVLKGAGVVAGGLAAIGAGGLAAAAAATPAAAAGFEQPPVYPAAQTLGAFIRVNGTDLVGDNNSDGRFEGGVEATYFQQAVATKTSASGLATGRRTYEPIVIRKRIDRTTPLLWKALVQNQAVDGIFKFYRPNNDGYYEQYYTVSFKGGRIVSLNDISPDSMGATPYAEGGSTPLEEVSFTFNTINWRIEDGGIEFSDSWSGKI